MNSRSILEALHTRQEPFAREALEQAVEQRESIAAALLELLGGPAPNTEDAPGYSGHYYAALLLCQFREPRCHRLLVEWGRQGEEALSRLFGGLPEHFFPQMLAATWSEDWQPLLDLIEDPQAPQATRIAGIKALLILAIHDRIDDEQLASAYLKLAEQGLEREPGLGSEVWSCLAECAALLSIPRAPEIFVEAYEREWLDDFAFSREEFLNAFSAQWSAQKARLRDHWQYQDQIDAIDVEQRWQDHLAGGEVFSGQSAAELRGDPPEEPWHPQTSQAKAKKKSKKKKQPFHQGGKKRKKKKKKRK